MPQKSPALFLAHGSPMLALSQGDYARKLKQLGQALPRPGAILVISAHWYTHGSRILNSRKPEQIYDFMGFPAELYNYPYHAQGNPELARHISKTLCPIPVQETSEWGLDHGTWTVLAHLYPKADVPVLQLSLDRDLTPRQYLDMGRRLRFLRNEGVLVMGSGNIVHNLRQIDWNESAPAHGWALEFDQKFQDLIARKDYNTLTEYRQWGELTRLAAPTTEHLDTLFYFLGILEEDETAQLFYSGVQHASATMTSYTSPL